MKSSQAKIDLTLYIHSKSPLSRSALKNLGQVSNNPDFKSKYELRVIEVDKEPEIAEEKNILATPLLIYKVNGIETRILGNLSDLHCVSEMLGIAGDQHEEP